MPSKPQKPRKPSLRPKPNLEEFKDYVEYENYTKQLGGDLYNLETLIEESGLEDVQISEIQISSYSDWDTHDTEFIINRRYRKKLSKQASEYARSNYEREQREFPKVLKKWGKAEVIYKKKMADYQDKMKKYVEDVKKYDNYLIEMQIEQRKAQFEKLKQEFGG